MDENTKTVLLAFIVGVFGVGTSVLSYLLAASRKANDKNNNGRSNHK